MGNRPSCAQEVSEMIGTFVASDMTCRRLLGKQRGRILFARLCFGRFAGCALRTALFVTSVREASHADEELREVLSLLSRAVRGSLREVSVKYSGPVLATDGASDQIGCGVARAGVGGILIDRSTHTFSYFAGVLSDAAVQELLSKSRNPIAAVELAAVLLCLDLWHREMQGRAVFGLIDNEAAKAILCGGYSPSPACSLIVKSIADLEIQGRLLCYWERVPSVANLADAPSRGEAPATVLGMQPQRCFLENSDVAPTLARHLLRGARDVTVTGC